MNKLHIPGIYFTVTYLVNFVHICYSKLDVLDQDILMSDTVRGGIIETLSGFVDQSYHI